MLEASARAEISPSRAIAEIARPRTRSSRSGAGLVAAAARAGLFGMADLRATGPELPWPLSKVAELAALRWAA